MGYFDTTCFYRVVPDFVIQGGESERLDTQRYKARYERYKISPEFRENRKHKYGAVALARDWKDNPFRYWKNHPSEKQELVKSSLEKKYSDSPQNRRDEAMRSCGFAGQTIMLAAKQMGLDSCPMVGFDYDQMAEIINLPDDHLIVLMIVVGKALEPAKERGGQLSLDEVVFKNNFN